jgi:hypothetical protein
MISFATHVTFLTKEIKLLPKKGKPSESNQCGFGGKQAVFRAHDWNVWEDESRGLKQKIEKGLTQTKLNSKFVLLQTPSEQLADYFLFRHKAFIVLQREIKKNERRLERLVAQAHYWMKIRTYQQVQREEHQDKQTDRQSQLHFQTVSFLYCPEST